MGQSPGYRFPPSGYAPRPTTFVLPPPGLRTLTEGSPQRRSDLGDWSQDGRYFYANVVFGAGGYAAHHQAIEAFLSSIQVLGPWAPAECTTTQVHPQLVHTKDRGFDILGFNFVNTGQPCRLVSGATLSIAGMNDPTASIPPPNHVSVAPVLANGTTPMGSWSMWNWCAAQSDPLPA